MARLIKDRFEEWKKETQERFEKLKENEEELNKIFSELYGLQDALDYNVSENEVSVSIYFDSKEDVPNCFRDNKGKIISKFVKTKEDSIKSLISYAVGCMFGRYSLDEEGLIFAGGEFDMNRYKTFKPDTDNILLLMDDAYFQDYKSDIVTKFIEFITVVYGKETLEENLDYIADVLPGSGTSRSKIRHYFISKFYTDHRKTYKNRPIYWQFDSGKGNGFKALIYLHRYEESLLATMRTTYVSKLREAYYSRIDLRENQIVATSNIAESNRYEKEIQKISKQLKELQEFDEKIGHLALKKISLDLDDGVLVNHKKLQTDPDTNEEFTILTKIK